MNALYPAVPWNECRERRRTKDIIQILLFVLLILLVSVLLLLSVAVRVFALSLIYAAPACKFQRLSSFIAFVLLLDGVCLIVFHAPLDLVNFWFGDV